MYISNKYMLLREIIPICTFAMYINNKYRLLREIFIGLMLKLNLQYFGHLRLRAKSLEKTLRLGKTEDRRG